MIPGPSSMHRPVRAQITGYDRSVMALLKRDYSDNETRRTSLPMPTAGRARGALNEFPPPARAPYRHHGRYQCGSHRNYVRIARCVFSLNQTQRESFAAADALEAAGGFRSLDACVGMPY